MDCLQAAHLRVPGTQLAHKICHFPEGISSYTFNSQSLLSLAFTCFQPGLGNGYSYPVKTDLEHLAKDDLSYENMMT